MPQLVEEAEIRKPFITFPLEDVKSALEEDFRGWAEPLQDELTVLPDTVFSSIYWISIFRAIEFRYVSSMGVLHHLWALSSQCHRKR